MQYPETNASLPTAPTPPVRASTLEPTDGARPMYGRTQSAQPIMGSELPPARPSKPTRSATLDTFSTPGPEGLSILRLDLQVGPGSGLPSGVSNPGIRASVLQSLEKSSVAQLLGGRMAQAVRHLEALRLRISDRQSKVLITGDLNAGKSTFVNTLLRRDIMPIDQQPCTTAFCEVLDALEFNAGKEEIHMPRSGKIYRPEDEDSYVRYPLEEAEELMAVLEESEGSPLLKCYCRDRRGAQESLLRNGVVDISLIDAPGLNRDSLKTTALFARQEEIDIIVFVVSAENHFTLSAKEFLWNASNEKAYVFVVVNKFDQIKNKDKCKRLVLEQIKQLSPRTYNDAEELVHFVDSEDVFPSMDDAAAATTTASPPGTSTADSASVQSSDSLHKSQQRQAAFTNLEQSLRKFVLLKRSKSKLFPAQVYVLRLLADVILLARTNVSLAQIEEANSASALALAKPALQDCRRRADQLTIKLEEQEDKTVHSASCLAQTQLSRALALVATGQSAHPTISLPPYPGLFEAWRYAEEVRQAMIDSLESAVREAEHQSRQITTESVATVKTIGEAHLPADVGRSNRVFLPDAMFSTKRSHARRDSRASFANHLASLGLPKDALTSPATDLLDVPHIVAGLIAPLDARRKKISDGAHLSSKTSSSTSGWLSDLENHLVGSFTLGLGALTLVGGKAFGAKAAVEGLVRTADLLGNKNVRNAAGPLFALALAGAATYVILDLPNSIPRNVGRSLSAAANATSATSGDEVASSASYSNGPLTRPSEQGQEDNFAALHNVRISREVRKVMRLASWDLQETFRAAISERASQVAAAEQQIVQAREACQYFDKALTRALEAREEVAGLHIGDDAPVAHPVRAGVGSGHGSASGESRWAA